MRIFRLAKVTYIFGLSTARISGLMHKEFTLIRRDRGTVAMLLILPVMMLVLFGFAIQLDPKLLPTAVIDHDQSPLTRSIITNIEASGYFKVVDSNATEAKAETEMSEGALTFILTFPGGFTRDFVRGENPQILIEVDGSDPGNSMNAVSHLQPIIDQSIFEFTSKGLTTPYLQGKKREATLIVHRNYNETNKSVFNIVPGLIGVLLTLTLVMITSTAITSEREAGTMELLLTTPLKPAEIILGKVIPYVLVGYVQLTIIVAFGLLVIGLPFEGSMLLLYLASAPFIVANLMIGMLFSTFARTAMQAVIMSIFFQLPSMFITGYVFTFYGMPGWARNAGSLLPMTYYMRIVRGIFLKGSDTLTLMPSILMLCAIATVLVVVTSMKFRKTLD